MSTLHVAIEIFFVSVFIFAVWTIITTLRDALKER